MSSLAILVDVFAQTLSLIQENETVKQYMISTASKGVGEQYGSEQTPRGWHVIRAKIGAGCPSNTVFVSRRPTGELYTPSLKKQFPNRDWILTRILWLSGTEKGFNRLGQCDTMRRYIYIHGCPDEVTLGVPGSRGCIRMHNHDLVELFNLVSVGTPVHIQSR